MRDHLADMQGYLADIIPKDMREWTGSLPAATIVEPVPEGPHDATDDIFDHPFEEDAEELEQREEELLRISGALLFRLPCACWDDPLVFGAEDEVVRGRADVDEEEGREGGGRTGDSE